MGVLDEIVAHKRAELVGHKAGRPLAALVAACHGLGPARDFEAALRPGAGERVRLIAEVKRGSPSRGLFRADLDPVAQAEVYARAAGPAKSSLMMKPAPARRRFHALRETFTGFRPVERPAWWGDAIVLVGLAVLLYAGVRLAVGAPEVIGGRDISLSPGVLPYYAALSLGRMLAAYALSLAFTLVYGYKAAFDRRAQRVLLPLLWPAILASVAVVFADTVDDFVIVRFLSGSADSEPLSVKIYSAARGSPTPAVNAAATVMLLSTMTVVAIGYLLYRRWAKGQEGADVGSFAQV